MLLGHARCAAASYNNAASLAVLKLPAGATAAASSRRGISKQGAEGDKLQAIDAADEFFSACSFDSSDDNEIFFEVSPPQ
jgi:hypothetical protein